jgi:hypothetical protein
MNRRHFLQSLLALPAFAQSLPQVRAITRGPRFHWRGYYDKLLFDPTDRYVLANEVEFEGRSPQPEDELRIGMVDTEAGDAWQELGSTRAWNWQQGCMLQWVPGTESTVAWNDRDGDHYVSHFLDVKTGKKRSLPQPFYTFSPDGKWAFAPDFRRLNDTRPGYGYCGVADPNKARLAPEDAGIWKTDLTTGKQNLIFSFAQAASIPFTGSKPEAAFKLESKHWFNHLLCNTDGSRLFFLHRWHAPGDKSAFYTRALTMNMDGSNVHVMDPHGGTSHFVWRDPQHVFAWAWHPSHGEKFYLYKDRSDVVEVIGPEEMTSNGHNTYLPGTNNEWVLNDTYPQGIRRLQNPYLYHIPSRRRVPLGHFPSPKAYTGEVRCDNHPCASRSGKKVVFDSAHEGGRQLYLVDVAELIRG